MHTYKKQFFLLLLVTKNWVPLQYTCRDIHKIKKSIKIPIKLTFYWITKNNLSIFDNGISLYQQEITRRHSSRMPAARLPTMHVSYCTNLNMFGRGVVQRGPSWTSLNISRGRGMGLCARGMGRGPVHREAVGSGPCTVGTVALWTEWLTNTTENIALRQLYCQSETMMTKQRELHW